MKPQGWYRDPFGVHQDRYFSDGEPTKLVRDGASEAFDEPPPGPLPGQLVEVPPSEPADNSGLLRADDADAGQPVSGKSRGILAALDTFAVYAPPQ